jgi:hypothetical protein
MSWYCVLYSAHVMVLCFGLCTRQCPCPSWVRCVLVQGMVLDAQIENPWISLTSFLHVIWASPKIHMKIMGQHLVIISRSAALRDTLTSEENPGVSEYLSDYLLSCHSA